MIVGLTIIGVVLIIAVTIVTIFVLDYKSQVSIKEVEAQREIGLRALNNDVLRSKISELQAPSNCGLSFDERYELDNMSPEQKALVRKYYCRGFDDAKMRAHDLVRGY